MPCDETTSNINEAIERSESEWLKVINENENTDLNRLSSKFGQKLSDDELKLTKNDKEILPLLKDISSMMLTPKSNNEPFQPILVMADGRRSAMPCDLSLNDLNILSTILTKISHNDLKARISDLLWLCSKPRNPKHARIAIDCYICEEISPETWYGQKEKVLERAYKLAYLLKDAERMSKIEGLVKEAFYSDDEGFQGLIISIARLIDKLNLLKDYFPDIALRLEKIGEQLISEQDFQSAIQFFELSAKKYKQAKDEPKSIFMLFKAAECYASDAEHKYNAGKGSRLISNTLFEEAIHAYRKIPAKFREQYSVDDKISALRHNLSDAGKNTLEEMGVINTPIDNADELIALSEGCVSGEKSLYGALVHLSGLVGLSKYEELKANEKEGMSKYFFSSLFGETQYSSDGRVVAKSPAVGFGDDQKSYDEALNAKMVRSFNQCLDFNVRLCIYPALEQILKEHHLSRSFIFQMCDSSPIVPKENINLICQAIWLGFEFDFSTAIHLVAPQMEKIVRMQLKQHNAHTTTIDRNGIEHENGLSTLLDMDEAVIVLGEDLLFELKAVFTSSHGANLRNEVAHGILTDHSAFSSAPVYAWWMLVRMVIYSLIKAAKENEQT